MNKNLLLCICALILSFTLFSQKTAKRELRGAWITTHFGLDWPNPNHNVPTQKANLLTILNSHKDAGINVIYFQVRNQGDALYPSSLEPWSSVLTGTIGKDPGWDPLQFAIEETHKRGMELHAWINPYRAVATASQLNSFPATHVAKEHPEWLLSNNSTITLNPGIPAVSDYITSVIVDITSRYDVDGIHFDDYFYPPPTFNDDAAYNANPKTFPATTTGRADWRRDNINLFIQNLYATLHTLKPWVKFGVSPSGIYRNGVGNGGSATTGAEHYSAVYADSKKWLQQKWVDYIAPQVYWHIGFTVADYSKLIPWWNDNAFDRHIYIGMASYKVNAGVGAAEIAAWKILTQYPNELRLNRLPQYTNVLGELHFRSATLITNMLGHRDSMRLNIYKRPALPPVMQWRDNTPPAAPSGLIAVKQLNNNYILTWTKPPVTSNESDKARQFVIYRSENPVINTDDTANLLHITPTDVSTYTDPSTVDKTYYYTVTAVDRGYVESAPSNVTDYLPPVITCPTPQTLSLDAACNATLPDFKASAIVSDDVTSTQSITVTQSPAAGTIVSGLGVTVVTLTATDLSGKFASCSFNVTRQDAIAPQITCNAPITVGTDAGLCSATLTVPPPSAKDNCSIPTVTGTRNDGAALSAPYPKGITLITWRATDASGLTDACTQTVIAEDREAPVIGDVSADPAVLFPPNHKMRSVTINYTATDNCGPVTTTLSVRSNETSNDRESDWELVNNHKIKLRAERWGYGTGRIYTITITARDEAGNLSTKDVTVTVPHDKGGIITTESTSPHGQHLVSEQTEVFVSPNPSTSHFKVTLSSTGKEPVIIKVMDNLNRVIETRSGIAPGSTLYLGASYNPGIYFLEVSQGKQQKVFKIIKQ